MLLVCRSGTTLGALASILNKANVTTLTAQTGADAWEIMRSGAVGSVVHDLTNFTNDAFVFFRSCRSSRNTFAVPFLFLTTGDYVAPKFDGVWPETARDAWLSLPCPSQQFLAAVRNLIDANTQSAPAPIVLAKPPDAIPTPRAATLPVQSQGKRMGSGVYNMLAVEAAALQDALFAGKLGTLNFSQILGVIEPLRLTGALKLFDGVKTGTVHFVDGKVYHAELNEIIGSEALFLLFHLNKGSFQFEISPPTQFRTVEGNTMSLLLEGMRKMDEAKAMVSAIKERQNTGAYAPVMYVPRSEVF